MSDTEGTASTPESEEVRAALREACDRIEALLATFERTVRQQMEAGR